MARLLSQQLGGDWLVVVGAQTTRDQSNFSWYCPAVRSVTMLAFDKHVVHAAQIFETRPPPSTTPKP